MKKMSFLGFAIKNKDFIKNYNPKDFENVISDLSKNLDFMGLKQKKSNF